MQHKHERLSERAVSGPTHKPRRLHAPGDQQQSAGDEMRRRSDPGDKRESAARDRRHVKA